jgi:Ni,Fe-hydrogenase III small subunit
MSFRDSLTHILHELYQEETNFPDKKISVVFGFYDKQSNFFQTNIPNDLFEKIKFTHRGVRNNIPIKQELVGCHTNYYEIVNSLWDIQIQFVLCEQQAIFITENPCMFQIIVGQAHIHKMVDLLTHFLCTEMYSEGSTTSIHNCYLRKI